MPTIYLVRHGRATAGWDVDPDPDIDELGRSQAQAVAERLASLPPMAIVSSPLLRCQQTAAPLAERWNQHVVIEPAVAEIPSPEGVAMADRVAWLRAAMTGTWTELGPRYTAYRDRVVEAITDLVADTIVFSHFVAINAVIGGCLRRDDLVIHSLDNCSITVVETARSTAGRTVELVESGHEADTLIR